MLSIEMCSCIIHTAVHVSYTCTSLSPLFPFSPLPSPSPPLSLPSPPLPQPHSLLPNGIITPPNAPSVSLSPIRAYNAANTARRSPQTFVINPSGHHQTSGHPIVTSLSPHMSGLHPLRGQGSCDTMYINDHNNPYIYRVLHVR